MHRTINQMHHEWSDIATAPKDGTPILGWMPDRIGRSDEVYVLVWFDFSYPAKDDIGRATGSVTHISGWMEAGGEEHATYRPSKWMKVPKP